MVSVQKRFERQIMLVFDCAIVVVALACACADLAIMHFD
jgi:hypothetical protein